MLTWQANSLFSGPDIPAQFQCSQANNPLWRSKVKITQLNSWSFLSEKLLGHRWSQVDEAIGSVLLLLLLHTLTINILVQELWSEGPRRNWGDWLTAGIQENHNRYDCSIQSSRCQLKSQWSAFTVSGQLVEECSPNKHDAYLMLLPAHPLVFESQTCLMLI